jgi:hypothetical protein
MKARSEQPLGFLDNWYAIYEQNYGQQVPKENPKATQ